jgi:small-conductance mechanosensitive channel
LTALIENERRRTLLDESLPMFSVKFFSQLLRPALWAAANNAIDEISWPDSRFFARHGWIVFLQVVLVAVTISSIRPKRQALDQSERWRFLAVRPVSAGLFLGYMSTILFYEYAIGVPATWIFVNTTVAAISFARLMGSLTDVPWRKLFINGLMVLLIATYLMNLLNFPVFIYRLYTLCAALAGMVFCWRLAVVSTGNQEPKVYRWLLYSAALVFGFIVCAELWGKRALATYLFAALIESAASILVVLFFLYLIRGALEWLLISSPLRRTALLPDDHTNMLATRLARLIDILVIGLVLVPHILVTWGAFDTLPIATQGLLSLGFTLGAHRFSVGVLLVSLGILYGSFVFSWVIQKLLVEEVLFKKRLEKGVRLSIGRLAHYAIVSAGFLMAISALGFEISKITIMLSALGVGIGFGLQSIANNFVSGLILLFERPVRVGDVIQIGGDWAEIKNIGIRATTVQTFDRADRIIPNGNLISNEVTNWTLTNRQIRLIIPVGVAYGSDVDRVTQTLLNCARTNPQVEKRPDPTVLFLNFGESSLDFELRVFVADFDHRIDVRSALHHQIDRSFREAGIEIAFPQRDLHLRSVDDSTGTQPTTA